MDKSIVCGFFLAHPVYQIGLTDWLIDGLLFKSQRYFNARSQANDNFNTAQPRHTEIGTAWLLPGETLVLKLLSGHKDT